ncbi:MAG TPA: hypothetical protein VJN95_08615 [Gemmatimonadales bacterium]|nr:hypothetical protein [Gemmatimonadales bacterium]
MRAAPIAAALAAPDPPAAFPPLELHVPGVHHVVPPPASDLEAACLRRAVAAWLRHGAGGEGPITISPAMAGFLATELERRVG